MDRQRLTVSVSKEESVSAVLTLPSGTKRVRGTAVVAAHGAGNDMEHPLLAAFTDGLAGAGYPAWRFNFPYKEKGLKLPDRPETLEATWAAVCRRAAGESGAHRLVAAGKSMGGRIASLMAADGRLPVEGLIFLGYPLHPAGDPSKTRDAHLYRIEIPMLFIAGTRDPLCDMGVLKPVLGRLPAPWTLDVVEGGDHSFQLPKSMGVAQPDVYARIVDTSTRWLVELFAD